MVELFVINAMPRHFNLFISVSTIFFPFNTISSKEGKGYVLKDVSLVT